MRIAFFEDGTATDLGPIALMRPLFELVCGQFSLRERLIRWLSVSEWGAFVRAYLRGTYRETHPEAHVNDHVWLAESPTLLLNGRWMPDADALSVLADDDVVGFIDDTVVALTIDPLEVPMLLSGSEDWGHSLAQLAGTRRAVRMSGRLVRRPWDLINHNATQLVADFRMRRLRDWLPPRERAASGDSPTPTAAVAIPASAGHTVSHPSNLADPRVALLGNADDVYVAPSASVDPFVVLDARKGPISIDAGAVVQAFTRLEGPCHVGRGSQLFRANVRAATTIGPTCRVGGEVEASILHSHVNKYHDGFLGHGYVCPWVNLGALTSNSDLKNDYSSIQVPLSGEPVDTELTKVGCFIGDYTKTAIASTFNTGSSVGVMSMILPSGTLLPKHIPSFCRIWHGALDDQLDLENCVESARVAQGRRSQELTRAQEQLLRFLYRHTQQERSRAMRRFRQKNAGAEDADLTAGTH